MNHAFIRVLGAFVFACSISCVHAAECRATSSVVASAASVQANSAAGGHVSDHVVGTASEVGKTLFDSNADFVAAFESWRGATGGRSGNPNPKNCGGSNAGVMDCVPAANVGISSASVCTAAAAGVCIATNPINPASVAFRYAHNAAGRWILMTAYPSPNSRC